MVANVASLIWISQATKLYAHILTFTDLKKLDSNAFI